MKDIPRKSWDVVMEEKAADMTHVLDFPYNGETPKVSIPKLRLVGGCMYRFIMAVITHC